MKSAILVLSAVCIVLLGTVVSSLAQPPGVSPPPGVSAANWVPISETAGIVLRGEADQSLSNSADVLAGTARERRTGTLMALHNGRWIEFTSLTDMSPQFFQLH